MDKDLILVPLRMFFIWYLESSVTKILIRPRQYYTKNSEIYENFPPLWLLRRTLEWLTHGFSK